MWSSNFILSFSLLCFTSIWQFNLCDDVSAKPEFEITDIGENFVQVHWNPELNQGQQSGNNGFFLKLKKTDENAWEQTSTQTTSEYQLTDLEPDTEYFIKFFSVKGGHVNLSAEKIVLTLKRIKECRAGWIKHKNYCYDFRNGRKTWIEAKNACSNKLSHLADIYNKEESDFMTAHIKHDTWIGGNDIEKEDEWRWTNGDKISYTNWESPEPNNIRNEDCAVMRRNHGMWNDFPCYYEEHYVCKYKLDESIESTEVDKRAEEVESSGEVEEEVESSGEGETRETFLEKTSCRSGWKKNKNYCYHFNDFKANWEQAKQMCSFKNSHLADIYNIEENNFMRENLISDLWIGGNDIEKEDEWRWTNGDKISYSNWERQEPNNWRNEDCAVIRTGHGLWNDYACTDHNYFVCKYKLDENVEISKEDEEFESSGEGGLCKEKWISYGDACYLFENKILTWHDANVLCENEDSKLVDIKNKNENDFLTGHITTDVWTSGNDLNKEGQWYWGDDKKMIFTNWGRRYPSSDGWFAPDDYIYHDEDCLIISGKTDIHWEKGYWDDKPCFLKKGFICKYGGEEIEEPFLNADNEENLKKDEKIECSIPAKEVESSEKEKSCKAGWKKNKNHCYYFDDNFEVTWDRAMEKCADEESHLADIYNENENAFLRANIKDDIFWIGGNDREEENKWCWTNGDKISYTNWEKDEPNNWLNDEDCAVIRSGHGLWNDDRCHSFYHYICKYSLDQNVESSKEDEEVESSEGLKLGGLCKKNWISFGNACYLFERVIMNWHDANVICINKDSHLVDVKNQEENEFIIEHTNGDVWTSGNDKENEGNWRWANGDSFDFTKWRYSEPNNAGFFEDCMSIIGETNNNWIKGYWYDDPCSFRKEFICKYTKEEANESFWKTDNEVTKESFSGTGSEETKESFSGTGSEETKEGFSGTGSEETKVSYSGESESSGSEGFDYYELGSANGKEEEIETTAEVETPFVKITPPEPFFFTETEENQETTETIPIIIETEEEEHFINLENEIPKSTNNNCKVGWEEYSEACYLFRSDIQNWNDAHTECLHLSGHLVDIQSNDELQYIKERSNNAWIGERHYMNTIEENYITEEQGCATIGHLNKDSTTHHNKEECLDLRPYVCKYYIKSDDNEIHPTWK